MSGCSGLRQVCSLWVRRGTRAWAGVLWWWRRWRRWGNAHIFIFNLREAPAQPRKVVWTRRGCLRAVVLLHGERKPICSPAFKVQRFRGHQQPSCKFVATEFNTTLPLGLVHFQMFTLMVDTGRSFERRAQVYTVASTCGVYKITFLCPLNKSHHVSSISMDQTSSSLLPAGQLWSTFGRCVLNFACLFLQPGAK